ncbi:MAG: hypothetical protein KAT75_05695, partial [Dehalococcoidia bacterium]|nr:hypothetical protein [Dehalococcoidia bacterium]
EKLFINLCYVDFGSSAFEHYNYPEEYAELAVATYLHLQSKYGFVPDAWEVILEPDNSAWNGTRIGNCILAATSRLEAIGFSPRFIAPSTSNMGKAPGYFDAMAQVLGILKVSQYIEEISYHRYGGVSDTSLQAIANRAVQYGINTSMLEWWSGGNGYHTLHKDLKMGRNSAWQQGIFGDEYNPPIALYHINPTNYNVTIGPKTKFTRQYYKFVRPGAVRIEATSNSGTFDPLAFINSNGKYVVVVKADAGGTFTIDRLPPGDYGIKYTTSSEYDRDLPDQSIGSGESVTTGIPGVGVLTVYQKCGTTNSGDLNNDTIVNFGDLAILAYYWTHCVCVEPHWCGCSDFNQSGSVNFTDFAI